MPSNRMEEGLDLLSAMVNAAAAKALSQLEGKVRMARCESILLNEGFSPADVAVEAWSVLVDHQAIVVSVFATGAPDPEGRTAAGSGRFTFTTLPGTKGNRA